MSLVEFNNTRNKGIPPHRVIMVTGELNARIGKDSHETNPRIVGLALATTRTPTTIGNE